MEDKYVKNNGLNCPICNSDKVILHSEDMTIITAKGTILVPNECSGCSKTWIEVYKLSGINLKKGGKE